MRVLSEQQAKQYALNKEHTIRPQPGDLWEEMMSVCFLVVWSDGEYMEYLDCTIHRISVPNGFWTWNFEKPLVRTKIEEFAKLVRYSSIDGFSCDVHENCQNWAITAALVAKKKTKP